MPLDPLPPNPPSRPSLRSRLLDAYHRSLSWRVRCQDCGFVEDAGNEDDAMWLYKGHGGDHERKGISADIRVFSAALIREQEPRSIRSLIFSAARGSVVEGIAARFSVETFTSAEIDKIAARGG